MDTTLPPRATLKAQAKRLRADLATKGQALTHAQALEAIAHQWGARDWNTLHAAAPETTVETTVETSGETSGETGSPKAHYAPLQRVTGRYLGHPFTGHVKAAQSAHGGFWRLTLVFDKAVDVVTSKHFSALRKQVNTTVGPEGHSAEKTSDGQPHMVIQQS
jgi:hypothetical protein